MSRAANVIYMCMFCLMSAPGCSVANKASDPTANTSHDLPAETTSGAGSGADGALAGPTQPSIEPANNHSEDRRAQLTALLDTKSIESLKTLLRVNGVETQTMQGVGRLIDQSPRVIAAPRTKVETIIDIDQITSLGRKYIVAMCWHATARPAELVRFGSIKSEEAIVFSEDGDLVRSFGQTDNECTVQVLSLGTLTRWFVWVQRSINEGDAVESDIFFLEDAQTPAIRLKHAANTMAFTPNRSAGLSGGSLFFFRDIRAAEHKANRLPTATGRDGATYQCTLTWDEAEGVFRGPSSLTTSCGLLYEVREAQSAAFVATD